MKDLEIYRLYISIVFSRKSSHKIRCLQGRRCHTKWNLIRFHHPQGRKNWLPKSARNTFSMGRGPSSRHTHTYRFNSIKMTPTFHPLPDFARLPYRLHNASLWAPNSFFILHFQQVVCGVQMQCWVPVFGRFWKGRIWNLSFKILG